MPQTPQVGDDVLVKSRPSQYDGLYGEVQGLIAATTVNPELAVVSLRPFGNKPGDTYKDTQHRQKFRFTEIKVISGAGGAAAQRHGNAAKDTDTEALTASSVRYTPKPSDRRDSPGSSYNGVEPQATLG